MKPMDLLFWAFAIAGFIAVVGASSWAYYRIVLLIYAIKVEIGSKRSEYRQFKHQDSLREGEQRQAEVRSEATIVALQKTIAENEADLARIKGSDAQVRVQELTRENESLRTTISSLQHQVQTLTLVGSDDPRVNPDGIAQRVVELLRDQMPVAPSAPVDHEALVGSVIGAVFDSGRLDSEAVAAGVVASLAPHIESVREGLERVDRHVASGEEVTQSQLSELQQRSVVQAEAVSATQQEMASLRGEVREILVSGLDELFKHLSTGSAPHVAASLPPDFEQRIVRRIEDSLDSLRAALVIELGDGGASAVGMSDGDGESKEMVGSGDSGYADLASFHTDGAAAVDASSAGLSVPRDDTPTRATSPSYPDVHGDHGLVAGTLPDGELPADDAPEPSAGPSWPENKRSLL